jgi:hypothetical protein
MGVEPPDAPSQVALFVTDRDHDFRLDTRVRRRGRTL